MLKTKTSGHFGQNFKISLLYLDLLLLVFWPFCVRADSQLLPHQILGNYLVLVDQGYFANRQIGLIPTVNAKVLINDLVQSVSTQAMF